MNKAMLDAFKALESIDDELVAPIKKVNNRAKLSESKKVINLDISGKDRYERGKAYYYAKTGDVVDIDGERYIIDNREHKIGYGDIIDLIKVSTNEPTTITKDEFIVKAKLLDEELLKEEPVYDLGTRFDSRKSFYGKARVDVKEDGTQVLYSYGTPVCRIENGKVTLLRQGYRGWNSSQTTLRHVKEFLKQNGFESGSMRELANMYPIEQARANESLQEQVVNLDNKEEVEAAKELIKDEDAKNTETIVDVDAETINELKDSYVGNVILRCPVCRTLIYKKPEALLKDESQTVDIYNVDEECPHCHAQDGFELVGQVSAIESDEVEVPTTTGKDSDVEDIEVDVTPEETVEVDEVEEVPQKFIRKESLSKTFVLEDINEQKFDSLINQYLVSTYNNVASYETIKGSVNDDNNTLVLEGVIKYKSGKERPTTFKFEAKSVTKSGRYRFVGINETFTKSRNAFSLFGRIDDNGCLTCESIRYSYGVKVLNENKIIKGKVEIKEDK